MIANEELRERLAEQMEFVLSQTPEALAAENAKLRELAHLLLWGVSNEMPRDEELVWSQKVDALARELGIEVDE